MWFIEDPWPPLFIGTLCGIVLLVVWAANARRSMLRGGLLCLLIGGSAWPIDMLVVTDAEQVELLVTDLADSVVAGNIEATLSHISEREVALRLAVTAGMNLVTVQNVRITDTSVEMLADNSRAKVHCRANGTLSIGNVSMSRHFPSRWNLTWQREGDEWKIIEVQRLNVVTGEEVELMSRN